MSGSDNGEENELEFEAISSSQSFLPESAEFLATLDELVRQLPTTDVLPSGNVSQHTLPLSPSVVGVEVRVIHAEEAKKYTRLSQILDNYQEQSHLLDPFLDQIVRPCILALRQITKQVTKAADTGDVASAQVILNSPRIHAMYKFLYHVCKVRGYKTTLKFFTHEVGDLEPTLRLILLLPLPRTNHTIWETRYILLLHLSLACMVPFDLARLDSGNWALIPGPGAPSNEAGSATQQNLVDRMVQVGKLYLSSTGKEGEGAAVMLARLLIRKDTVTSHLSTFLEWAMDQVKETSDVFLLKHLLQTLSLIYKLGQRDVLLPTLPAVTTCLGKLTSQISGSDPAMRWDPRARSNSLMRKLVVKLSGRVGTCYLKPRSMTWIYRRGQRSLLENLHSSPIVVDSLGPVATNRASFGRPALHLESTDSGTPEAPNLDIAAEDDEDFNPPDALEDILDILLFSLRDRDTIVRWSSAKALGRVASRLPSDLAQDVVSAVLDLFREDVSESHGNFSGSVAELDLSACSDHSWHGACLALAELARRGLLLPSRVPDSVPWVLRALGFDQRRGAHSVGAHVRDAACYVLWSFARVYPADVVRNFTEEIAVKLAVTSALDREVNVRRAASAAFQEGVGRLGTFPRGLEILTKADYFAVGNRQGAFLVVGIDLASFPEYREPLVSHLTRKSAAHWDSSVRELAATCLGRIIGLNTDNVVPRILETLLPATMDPDVATHHGALLATAEVCLAWASARAKRSLHEDKHSSSEFTEEELRTVVIPVAGILSSLPSTFLNSFGSEFGRSACCRLIECLAEAQWPISIESCPPLHLETWWNIVTTSLERKEEAVQERAVAAVRSLSRQYDCPTKLVDNFITSIQPTAEKVARRGYVLALGALPAVALVRTGTGRILHALSESARIRTDKRSNDAEAKRNSVVALVQIVETLNEVKEGGQIHFSEAITGVIQTLLDCLADFSTDQRGDVGSWIREASMRGLRSVLRIAWRKEQEDGAAPGTFLPKGAFQDLVARVLSQSVERIDRVRQTAGECFVDLLWSGVGLGGKDGSAVIIGRDLLEEACPKHSNIAWSSPSEVFYRIVPLIVIPAYRIELLTGLLVSAGGLTESLVRHSNACLLDFVSALPVQQNEPVRSSSDSAFASHPSLSHYPFSLLDFFIAVREIFIRNKGRDRVVVPLFEVMDTILETGVVSSMSDIRILLDLVELTKAELTKTKDVKKITAGVKFCAILTDGLSRREVQVSALEGILTHLFHPFPRVRRSTAEQLYVSLTSMEEESDAEQQYGEQLMCDGDGEVPNSTVFTDKNGLEELLLESDWDQNITDELKISLREKLDLTLIQRDDQQRALLLERTQYYAKAEQVAQFEQKTTENIKRNRLRKRFGELKAGVDEEVEQRREKLRALLASDINQWRSALTEQEETQEQKVAKLRERASELKEKREDERRKVVEEKLLQRFRNEAPELRIAESQLLCQQVSLARAAQLHEKHEAAARLAESNARYAALWEHERLKKVAREEEDRNRAKSRNEEMVRMLDAQMEELALKQKEEDNLKKDEAELMRQQLELRNVEERRASLLKQASQRSTRESLDAFNAELRARRADALRRTRELDLSVLQQYVKAEAAQRDRLTRERAARVRETQAYMDFLATRRSEEMEEEKRIGRMYAEEAERAWRVREEGWAKEQRAREKLMAEVLKGREEQLRDAIARNIAAQEQSRLEQATLAAQIAAIRASDEAVRREREDAARRQRDDLGEQMRRKEERKGEERERAAREAEEERLARDSYERLLAQELASMDRLPRIGRFLQANSAGVVAPASAKESQLPSLKAMEIGEPTRDGSNDGANPEAKRSSSLQTRSSCASAPTNIAFEDDAEHTTGKTLARSLGGTLTSVNPPKTIVPGDNMGVNVASGAQASSDRTPTISLIGCTSTKWTPPLALSSSSSFASVLTSTPQTISDRDPTTFSVLIGIATFMSVLAIAMSCWRFWKMMGASHLQSQSDINIVAQRLQSPAINAHQPSLSPATSFPPHQPVSVHMQHAQPSSSAAKKKKKPRKKSGAQLAPNPQPLPGQSANSPDDDDDLSDLADDLEDQGPRQAHLADPATPSPRVLTSGNYSRLGGVHPAVSVVSADPSDDDDDGDADEHEPNSSGKVPSRSGHSGAPGADRKNGPHAQDHLSPVLGGGHSVPVGGTTLAPPTHHSAVRSSSTHKKHATVNHSHPSSSDVWFRSDAEEKSRIREFWLGLTEEERRRLVRLEKEAVLRKMKEQQRHTCQCAVCGRKRTVIEEELEQLYDAYYEELEHFAHQARSGAIPASSVLPFTSAADAAQLASSSAVSGRGRRGHHTHQHHSHGGGHDHRHQGYEEDVSDEDVDDDADEGEDIGEGSSYGGSRHGSRQGSRGSSSMGRAGTSGEVAVDFGRSLTVKGGLLTVADDFLKNDGRKFLELMETLAERKIRQMDAGVGGSQGGGGGGGGGLGTEGEDENGNWEDEEEEEYDEDDEEYEDEEDPLTEEQRMEEGRRMFQIFAAKMFEQRVLAAYREKVAFERQQRLFQELEEEQRNLAEREANKAKKNEKKRLQKKAEKQRREEERREAESKKRDEEERIRKEEEARREAERIKKEELRKQQEEERRRREEAEAKKREQERQRKEELRKQQEARERARKEKEEKERKDREEKLRKEQEEKARRDEEEKKRKEEQARKALAEKEAAEKERADRERMERERLEREKEQERERAEAEEQAELLRQTVPGPLSVPVGFPGGVSMPVTGTQAAAVRTGVPGRSGSMVPQRPPVMIGGRAPGRPVGRSVHVSAGPMMRPPPMVPMPVSRPPLMRPPLAPGRPPIPQQQGMAPLQQMAMQTGVNPAFRGQPGRPSGIPNGSQGFYVPGHPRAMMARPGIPIGASLPQNLPHVQPSAHYPNSPISLSSTPTAQAPPLQVPVGTAGAPGIIGSMSPVPPGSQNRGANSPVPARGASPNLAVPSGKVNAGPIARPVGAIGSGRQGAGDSVTGVSNEGNRAPSSLDGLGSVAGDIRSDDTMGSNEEVFGSKALGGEILEVPGHKRQQATVGSLGANGTPGMVGSANLFDSLWSKMGASTSGHHVSQVGTLPSTNVQPSSVSSPSSMGTSGVMLSGVAELTGVGAGLSLSPFLGGSLTSSPGIGGAIASGNIWGTPAAADAGPWASVFGAAGVDNTKRW
ncbi:hypothetical protein HDU93_004492 [Gonapodya sp. JEL0774]|nr:hypothetical protein HDU93_004492 [Gonapodya sp. JEL0774]